jgi:hypothetical protein
MSKANLISIFEGILLEIVLNTMGREREWYERKT